MTDHYTDPSDKPSDYSVTKLISPIQETVLKSRYDGSSKLVTHDVLDYFKSWTGSVLHNALEAAWKESMDSIVEQRFYKTIQGKVISGKVDCYEAANKKIIDYKTMALYKYTKKDFSQFEKQANLYAMLLREAGHEVEHLEIVALILDWKKQEAKYKKDYPKAPIVTIPLKLWTATEAIEYAETRVSMLEAAKQLSEEELYEQYPCSYEEKWQADKGWSIHKKGTERATKVFDNEQSAREFLTNHKTFTEETHEIRHRFGEARKCLDYCDCKMICKQYKEENK
jgi:hypothetical protein